MHTSQKTQNKIEELGDIEILSHPPYSPDLAPSDYHLFRSLAHFLLGRQFNNVDDVEVACRDLFTSKPREWYHQGIEDVAQRWVRIIESNGLYLEE